MKIAVTGATGFIGRHVRNAFAETEQDVVLVVRDTQKVGNKFAREEIVLADISQAQNDWFELLGKPDALLHMAWGGLPHYMDNHHVDVELPMQARFLTAIVNSGLKKLVVTGTCYEYGLSSGALSENQETNPNTPYGVAKDNLRRELFNLQSAKNFDLTWARVFYPYGEGQSENSLYSSISKAIREAETSFVITSGNSLLDFISVVDVSRVLAWFATVGSGIGLVNLGTGNPLAVSEFVRRQARSNSWEFNIQNMLLKDLIITPNLLIT